MIVGELLAKIPIHVIENVILFHVSNSLEQIEMTDKELNAEIVSMYPCRRNGEIYSNEEDAVLKVFIK
jgi:hypothetical protein